MLPLKVEEVSAEVTRINDNFYMLNCDLNESSIQNLLLPNGFDPQEQSFLLAEGLTTYIDEASNIALLNTIHSLFEHEKSSALIGYVDKATTIDGVAQRLIKNIRKIYYLPYLNLRLYILLKNKILLFLLK